jgi:hypothetical protein
MAVRAAIPIVIHGRASARRRTERSMEFAREHHVRHDQAAARNAAEAEALDPPVGIPGKTTLVELLLGGIDGRAVPDPGARPAPGRRTLVGDAAQPALEGADPSGNSAVQRRARRPADGDVHAAARRGVAGPAAALPFVDRIQRLFGRHDVSRVQAHTDASAAAGADAMGAEAFAFGEHVAFSAAPTLFTAAHEAAHVIQQRAGVHLQGGIGQPGDAYERHADAVAARVVAGQSAADLLDAYSDRGAAAPGVQCMIGDTGDHRPVVNREHRRYLATRTGDDQGVTVYRLLDLETGAIVQDIRADDETYDLAFNRRITGEIIAANEEELTLRYAPGHTVVLDLCEFALDLLQPGDHVSFSFDDEGGIDESDAVPRSAYLIDDAEGGVGPTETGNVLDISAQQQDGPTCWAAATASVAAYHGNDAWTQDALIQDLGPLADADANVTTALQRTGNLGAEHDDALSFAEVRHEIDGGRPIIAGLRGLPGHVVLICGYDATADQQLCIADSNYGGRHTWVNYRHFALGAVQYQLGLKSPPPHGDWGVSWTTAAAGAEHESEHESDDHEGAYSNEEFEALLDEALANQPEDDMAPDEFENQFARALLDLRGEPEAMEFLLDGEAHRDLLPSLLRHDNRDVAEGVLRAMLGEDVMALMDIELAADKGEEDL